MAEPDGKLALEDDVAVHIFTASAAMIGVCLTVIGLFKLGDRLKGLGTWADELLAVDAAMFMVSCLLAYLALRARRRQRKYRMEKAADLIFLAVLSLMAVACALIAYEFI